MKRLIIAVTIFVAWSAFGDEQLIMDFTSLTGDPVAGQKISLSPETWNYEREKSGYDEGATIDDDILIDSYTIGYHNLRYEGQTVFRICGSLNSDFPGLYIEPPVEIPDDDAYIGIGMLRDIEPIKRINVNVCSLGEPVYLNLDFSDDQGNYFMIGYLLDGVIGVWYQYTFVNPFYWLESRFPEFLVPRVTLRSIGIRSHAVDAYMNQRYRDTALMTEEEKADYEFSHPVLHIEQDFNVLIRDIIIVHGEEVW